MKTTEEEYNNLVTQLNFYADRYYSEGSSTISDETYDALYKKLLEYEQTIKQHPDSPSKKVGAKLQNTETVKRHRSKMYSLENINNKESMEAWIEKSGNLPVLVELKYDGVSLNLIYENGKLVEAITRGDGEIGEAVMHNAKVIPSIPKVIMYKGPIEIRGEIVILKNNFTKFREEYKNERNFAAGSIRHTDPEVVRDRNLTFIPYGLGSSKDQFKTQDEIIDFLLINNFSIPTGIPKPFTAYSTKEIEDFYINIMNSRDTLPVIIDGVVLKINSLEEQDKKGFTSRAPNFAVAYKFPSKESTSTLKNIEWGINGSGVFTPVAIFEPVEIGGVTVQRATLHNIAEIRRLNLRNNASVVVSRRGDVIPKIEKSIGGDKEVQLPTICPHCSAKLEERRTETTQLIVCPNLSCKGTLTAKVMNFTKALKIKGFGESVVTELIETGIIEHSLASLYDISVEKLLARTKFKTKSATNLVNAVMKTKEEKPSWIDLFDAVGLGGKTRAKKILSKIDGTQVTCSELVKDESVITQGSVGQLKAKELCEIAKIIYQS